MATATFSWIESDKQVDDGIPHYRITSSVKPTQWTADEYATAMSDWRGTQTQLIDLIGRAGPVIKVDHSEGPITYVYFGTIVLAVQSDPRDCGLSVAARAASPDCQDSHPTCVFTFTHPDSQVDCRLYPDEGYGRDGKPIIICRVNPVDAPPRLPDSDDELDWNGFQGQLNAFGARFQAKKLDEPITLEMPLP